MHMIKTKYLKMGKEVENSKLKIKDTKMCKEYKYLGSILSKEGNTNRDTENRTQQGKKSTRISNFVIWSKEH